MKMGDTKNYVGKTPVNQQIEVKVQIVKIICAKPVNKIQFINKYLVFVFLGLQRIVVS